MITLAQIGVGAWGQNLLRNFFSLKDCTVKMCCDKRKEILEKVRSRYDEKIKLTDNFEEVLNDKAIDAVVIATPVATHAKLTIEALSANKDVFVEKPLAFNLEDGQKMVEIAERNKRILMVGHLLLYHPGILKVRDYISNGEIGKVLYSYSTRVNLGRIREEESALWSLTSHDISVALFLLDDLPLEVSARGESYLRKGIEDVVFVTLKFKNNVLFHIHASWLDPHKMRKFTIVGTKKMVVFDDMDVHEKIKIYDKGVDYKVDYKTYAEYLNLRNGDIHIPRLGSGEPLVFECQHFVDCVKNRLKPKSDGKNGLDVLKVLSGAQDSLENGGKSIALR
ncbi:Gfo/Idh/MocA family protein [Candidatus Omnitrophota bacterium]